MDTTALAIIIITVSLLLVVFAAVQSQKKGRD